MQLPESEIAPVTDLPRLESLPEPNQKDLKVTMHIECAASEHCLPSCKKVAVMSCLALLQCLQTLLSKTAVLKLNGRHLRLQFDIQGKRGCTDAALTEHLQAPQTGSI